MRIGVMGGTFDPVHKGHLAIARSAAEQLDLDRVLFIPTGHPHFKLDRDIAPADERARMVALAIEDDPLFELDTREIERPGVTYTADTLEELVQTYPKSSLFFITGADSAVTLPRWKRAEEIARLCTIVVAHRPGDAELFVPDVLASAPIDFDVIYIDAPQIDVSSTSVRERAARGEDVSDSVPLEVAQHIAEQGLYR